MGNARIELLLLLEKQLGMALLECKRQLEAFDGERYLLRIVVEPQQIELADNRLDTPLELTYTLLSTRIVLNDVL